MKQETAHRQSNLIHNSFAVVILFLASITPVYAASDIIVTRPHSESSTMSSNFYLGVNVGSAMYDEIDDSSAAFSFMGGYRINDILAVEFAWTDLGEATQNADKVEVSALQVGLVGSKSVNTNLVVFGEVGLARWEFDANISPPSGPDLSGTDNDVDVYFGFGADYLINSRSTVRFKVDFYSMKPTISNVDLPEEKITLITIGYIFKL